MKKTASYLFSLLLLTCAMFAKGQQSKAQIKPAKIVRTQGVNSATVVCQLQDARGNLWFSISGEGAYCYDGKRFINFTTKNGLRSNEVGPIIEDKAGNILIGTGRGINRYNGKSFTMLRGTDTFSITSLLEDKNGDIWFATMNNGVYRWNEKRLTNFLSNDDHKFNLGAHYQLIMDILEDMQGNIWFSSWNGGGVWRYDGKAFTNFLPSPAYYAANEDKRSQTNSTAVNPSAYLSQKVAALPDGYITDDMIYSMTLDRAGNIWFATRKHGPCIYDGKTFKRFAAQNETISKGVYAMLEDRQGNMWFTTERNGVFCYEGKTFRNYTTADGLVNNAVVSVMKDKEGKIWFGTKWFGLSCFDGKRFITYSGDEYK